MLKQLLEGTGRVVRAAAITRLIIYKHQGSNYVSEVRAAERGPLLALVATAVLAAALPARVWLVITVALALLVAICLRWVVQGARRVRLERQLRFTWVQVGDRLEEIFTLHNDAFVPILAAEIEDHSNLPGYNASTVRSVGGYSRERWRQNAISRRRGVFHIGPTTVRFSDPLGLFEVTCHYPYVREVLVFPPVLPNLVVQVPTGGGHGTTTSRQRDLAETAAIGGIRDYRPGDPIRRVHWPLSMHHGSFQIKEFDEEKGSDVWLALDLDHAVHTGEGEESTLEYAIIWAASWAWHLLRQGKGVGLYAYGPERTLLSPRRGVAQLRNILRALAPLQTQMDWPLRGLLREIRPVLGRSQSLIVITPSTDPEWPIDLMRPGLRSAAKGVILLDAASFRVGSVSSANVEIASSPPAIDNPALVGIRASLASMGVPVCFVCRQASLEARPSTPGTGDWEFITTPWGRVVTRSSPAEARP